jgi:TRAP-type transport system periplasmic protein
MSPSRSRPLSRRCFVKSLVAMGLLASGCTPVGTAPATAPAASKSAPAPTTAAGAAAPTTADAPAASKAGAGTAWRLTHAAATSHPHHDGVVRFVEALDKATNGAVKIEVFPARQLGDDIANLQQVQLGAIEMAAVSTAVFGNQTPLLNALQLPFLIPSYDAAAKVFASDATYKLLDKLEAIKLKGLAVYEGGFRHFLSTRGQITTPADLAGLKTRVVQAPLHIDIWTALGGNPTPLAYGEVYTALQTRTIDSVEINVSSIFAEKFYEVAKDFTLLGHYMFPALLFANLDKFNSLPADQQRAMATAAREVVKAQVDEAKRQDQEQLEQLKRQGLVVYDAPNTEPFKTATQPVYDKYTAMDPAIKTFADEAADLVRTG